MYRKQKTTYKDVANELIEQLRKNNSDMNELDGLRDLSDYEIDSHEESSDDDIKSPEGKLTTKNCKCRSGRKMLGEGFMML